MYFGFKIFMSKIKFVKHRFIVQMLASPSDISFVCINQLLNIV